MPDLDTSPATAPADGPRSKKKKRERGPHWSRQIFMLVLAVVVITIVLVASLRYGNDLFIGAESGAAVGAEGAAGQEVATPREQIVLPYFTALAGVLLFIMDTARRKRKTWVLRDYWGDFVFRIAQAFAYLFVIMWAWAQGLNADVVGADVPPNILGFLVGFFILRVERAMEGMGAKLEEVLMAILPRSIAAVSAEERRRQQLRATYKLDEIATQYEAVRPNIRDLGGRDQLDKRIADAQEILESDEPERARPQVQDLSRQFEELKRHAGEVLVSVDDLLGRERGGPSARTSGS